MKKTLMLMSIVAMALMLSVSTASAWHLSLEPISVLPNCEPVNTGDTFYADVFFNADPGGNSLSPSYQFAIGYDATELTWNDGSQSSHTPPGQQHTPPSPMMQIFGPAFEDTPGNGEIRNFAAGLFVGEAIMTGKYRLAHIEFTATPDMYCDGELDVWFTDSEYDDEVFKVDGIEIEFLKTPGYMFEGPSISQTGNPVPIPSAVLLFASAFLGLIGIRNGLSA